jgi:hypothetical protein
LEIVGEKGTTARIRGVNIRKLWVKVWTGFICLRLEAGGGI